MRRLFILSITLLLALEMHALGFELDNLWYRLNDDGTSECSGYGDEEKKPVGQIEIPSTVTYNNKSYSVTSVGYMAFYECKDLTSVTIPEGVTSIGSEAFWSCYRLTSITIPSTVSFIGGFAFEYCGSLTSIMLPEGFTSIEEGIFWGCNLKTVVLPSSLSSIGTEAFSNCYDLTTITIPEGVTSIGDKAFGGCGNLEEIYVRNPAPPVCNTYEGQYFVFNGVDKSTCKLYVPIGSKEDYAVADEWKDFKNIEEIDMTSASESEEAPLMISTDGDAITITGAEPGASITVYTVTGTQLLTLPATGEEQRIALPSGGLYFVKVGSQTMKVVL